MVKIKLAYPYHREFTQYKKGQPRPKYRLKNKIAPYSQYNKRQEEAINEILSEWENQTRKVLGKYVYVRDILPDSADDLTIHNFKDDFKTNLSVNSCVTHGYFLGVAQLDIVMEVGFETDNKEGIDPFPNP